MTRTGVAKHTIQQSLASWARCHFAAVGGRGMRRTTGERLLWRRKDGGVGAGRADSCVLRSTDTGALAAKASGRGFVVFFHPACLVGETGGAAACVLDTS
jgi:hypothetical protein